MAFPQAPRSSVRGLFPGLIALVLALQLSVVVDRGAAAEPAVNDDGLDDSVACANFGLGLKTFFGDAVIDNRSDEGWVWVDGSDRYQEITGRVADSFVSHRDTAANHYSHDVNVNVVVDEGQEWLVSEVGRDTDDPPTKPRDTMQIEWETGTQAYDHFGDGPDPFLPMWAWPSPGDRVWADGHWVYDCGHPDAGNQWLGCRLDASEDGACRYRSEIHPARAMAAMRDQSRTLPGSGTTRVPVTATDLYIHGRGGFMIEQLYCGMSIIVDGDRCDTKTSSIAEHFDFDVCIPPRPSPTAQLSRPILNGPGNTVTGFDPTATVVPASDACKAARWEQPYLADVPKFDQDWMLHIDVDLSDSGIADTAVYARQIYAGWVFPPELPMRHFRVSLTGMDLENDHDPDALNGDCECTFFWLNVDTAEAQGNPVRNEWIRLQDYTDSNMNDYDDWHAFGDGEIDFHGADFEFYVRDLPPFGGERFLQFTYLKANGYDQDCNDLDLLGEFKISVSGYLNCFIGEGALEGEAGREDAFATHRLQLAASAFHGTDYIGDRTLNRHGDGSEYALDFTVVEIPLADEDTADVGVTKDCAASGEVAVQGLPVTCTITVTNYGPGLPRALTVTDEVLASAGGLIIDSAAFAFDAEPDNPHPCTINAAAGVVCHLGSLPVGEQATVTVAITPFKAGSITNTAEVTTLSTDPDDTNNHAHETVEVFLPVDIDVKPSTSKDPASPINLNSRGSIPVAVLSTADFDATTLDPSSVCFGDADNAAERSCTEEHATGHVVDVNKDGREDLLLHYATTTTGIDLGDKSACLTGRTTSGISVYGCEAIVTL